MKIDLKTRQQMLEILRILHGDNFNHITLGEFRWCRYCMTDGQHTKELFDFLTERMREKIDDIKADAALVALIADVDGIKLC